MATTSDGSGPESIQRIPNSRMFRAFRAAYIASVIWCAGMLMAAWSVWIPGKGRPGTYFARDTFPTILALSFSLFFVGALCSMLSRQAGASTCFKWSVCGAFALMILAQLFLATGR